MIVMKLIMIMIAIAHGNGNGTHKLRIASRWFTVRRGRTTRKGVL